MICDEERGIEWDCHKVLREWYFCVDFREFEKGVQLYTEDADWDAHGLTLKGRDQILEAVSGALRTGTARHIMGNTVVNVIDENHATSRSYRTCYYDPDEGVDGVAELEGPHRLEDDVADLVRTDDGWKISRRVATVSFRCRPQEAFGLDDWIKAEGKL